MKILHILVDGRTAAAEQIVDAQSAEHEVEIVDLTQGEVSYDRLVDTIFACDKVISW